MHFIKNCRNHFVFCRLMSALSAKKKITMHRIVQVNVVLSTIKGIFHLNFKVLY